MCGIFGYLYEGYEGYEGCDRTAALMAAAMKIRSRGPDETRTIQGTISDRRYLLVFHRLAINGLLPDAGQPITLGDLILLCNGEIYNYRELALKYGLADKYRSGSDCEIILHLYRILRDRCSSNDFMSELLGELRGEFAFMIVDTRRQQIVVARDPFGVRSLYYLQTSTQGVKAFGVCSELKGLHGLSAGRDIHMFPAGSWGTVSVNLDSPIEITRYYDVRSDIQMLSASTDSANIDDICSQIRARLTQAIKRRILCDRVTESGYPAIGAFLSGGLDSSIVATLLSQIYPGPLVTFSIGFSDAPDLKHARLVAKHIGSTHHEYIVTEKYAVSQLTAVNRQIESPDVTTNRASTFMYMLSHDIRHTTDIVVVFSGEGIDEIFGSYLYFHNAPDSQLFQEETLRLTEDLQYFDLLRGDKTTASAGLELRPPCLDVDFIDYVRRIPPELKMRNGIEKWILRKAFENVLPEEICWRTKEAMSDGVSLYNRSWSKIIQEYTSADVGGDGVEHERMWFRNKFLEAYPGCEHIIPYDWLPKWCGDVRDASARALQIYRDKNVNEDVSYSY